MVSKVRTNRTRFGVCRLGERCFVRCIARPTGQLFQWQSRRSYVFSFLLLFTSLFFFPFIGATQVSLYTQVSPESGTPDDLFSFSVIVENGSGTPFPTLSGGADFHMTYLGPQTSVVILNGSINQKSSYVYQLVPTKEGELKTPAVELPLPSGVLRAPALTVHVSKSAAPKIARNSAVTVQQGVPNESYYVGEQIVQTVDVLAAEQLYEAELPEVIPDGFVVLPFGSDQRSRRAVNGRMFDVLRQRKVLFALRPGELELPARELHAKMRDLRSQQRPQLDPFDPLDLMNSPQFFNDFLGMVQLRAVEARSNSIRVKVNPLPPLQTPLALWQPSTPLVGETSVTLRPSSGRLDGLTLKTGETLNLELDISSFGNLSPYKEFELALPDGIKSYEETPQFSSTENGGRALFHRKSKIAVVPLQPGHLTIPGVAVGFFDPSDATYKTARTRDIELEVVGAPIGPSGAASSTRGGERAPLAHPEESVTTPRQSGSPTPETRRQETLTYAPPSLYERLRDEYSPQALLLFGGVALSLLGFAALLLRIRRAARPWQEALAGVESCSSLEELARAYRSALGYNLGVRSENLRGDGGRKLLETTPLGAEVRFELQTLLDEIDRAVYGLSGPTEPEGATTELVRLRARALASLNMLPPP